MQYVYKYAVQDLHRKQVHVSSVPRHCVPSEISRAIDDGTETPFYKTLQGNAMEKSVSYILRNINDLGFDNHIAVAFELKQS